MNQPINYLKHHLVEMAKDAMQLWANKGFKSDVFFKATCPICHNRCRFVEPNTIRDYMECCMCGAIFPFTEIQLNSNQQENLNGPSSN